MALDHPWHNPLGSTGSGSTGLKAPTNHDPGNFLFWLATIHNLLLALWTTFCLSRVHKEQGSSCFREEGLSDIFVKSTEPLLSLGAFWLWNCINQYTSHTKTSLNRPIRPSFPALKCFSNQTAHQLSPLNICKSKKLVYSWSSYLLNNHTKF